MNNIDAKITAWQLGPVTIMRGTATPGRDVTHPECFGRFTVVALSYGGAIRKCMRRVAQMCAKHSACEPVSYTHLNESLTDNVLKQHYIDALSNADQLVVVPDGADTLVQTK